MITCVYCMIIIVSFGQDVYYIFSNTFYTLSNNVLLVSQQDSTSSHQFIHNTQDKIYLVCFWVPLFLINVKIILSGCAQSFSGFKSSLEKEFLFKKTGKKGI